MRFRGALCAMALQAAVVCVPAATMLARTEAQTCRARASTQRTPAERPDAGARDVDLFVARRGWHVDVGFGVDAAPASMQGLVRELSGARYLFMGFGDRRYLRAHHRLPAMLAALWPGRGLMLATGLTALPAEAFGADHVIRIRLSPQQWTAAQRFIVRSFGVRGAPSAGNPADAAVLEGYRVGPGPYAGSLYYSSSATYSAWHTCNTWVAEVLRNAGLPVRTKGVVFAGQVWGEAAGLAEADAARPRAPTSAAAEGAPAPER